MRRNPQESALQDLFLNTHRYISLYNTYRTPSLRFVAHIFLFQGARDMREDCPLAHGHALVQDAGFSLPRANSPYLGLTKFTLPERELVLVLKVLGQCGDVPQRLCLSAFRAKIFYSPVREHALFQGAKSTRFLPHASALGARGYSSAPELSPRVDSLRRRMCAFMRKPYRS